MTEETKVVTELKTENTFTPDTYIGEAYEIRYRRLHKDINKQSDEDVIDWLCYFSRYKKLDNDICDIGIRVCDDIMLERIIENNVK